MEFDRDFSIEQSGGCSSMNADGFKAAMAVGAAGLVSQNDPKPTKVSVQYTPEQVEQNIVLLNDFCRRAKAATWGADPGTYDAIVRSLTKKEPFWLLCNGGRPSRRTFEIFIRTEANQHVRANKELTAFYTR